MKTMRLAGAIWALGLGTALASEEPKVPPPETEPPKTVEPVAPDTRDPSGKVGALAKEFAVPERQVAELREKGMGWGEVRHALSLSQRSGKSVTEVMALRDSGLGWGQVAHRLGVKLGKGEGAAAVVDPGELKNAPRSPEPKRVTPPSPKGHGQGRSSSPQRSVPKGPKH